MEKKKNKVLWYDNSNIITSAIIGLIIFIIILSQSFAVNNELSTILIFRDIINHNINYILILIYFIFLKFSFGKKYFNYLNVFLSLLYLIFTITSFLSVFQSISIINILSLAIKVILFIYLIHTMFIDTRYYKECKLNKSPFNEFSNEDYFCALSVLAVVLFLFNLFIIKSYDGAIISLLDTVYVILLARYIYLYKDYLDLKTFVKLKENEKKEEE